jgi:hypothetical protein
MPHGYGDSDVDGWGSMPASQPAQTKLSPTLHAWRMEARRLLTGLPPGPAQPFTFT